MYISLTNIASSFSKYIQVMLDFDALIFEFICGTQRNGWEDCVRGDVGLGFGCGRLSNW